MLMPNFRLTTGLQFVLTYTNYSNKRSVIFEANAGLLALLFHLYIKRQHCPVTLRNIGDVVGYAEKAFFTILVGKGKDLVHGDIGGPIGNFGGTISD